MATKLLRRHFGAWGTGSELSWPFHVSSPLENVAVGKGVKLGPYMRVRAPGRIVIGDGCRFLGMTLLSAQSELIFGESVVVAWGAQFMDEQHVTTDRDSPIMSQGLVCTGPIHVEDGAWIGTNAVIMGGVTIGRNAIVGANAVVREDVPPHHIAVGVPAVVKAPRGVGTAA